MVYVIWTLVVLAAGIVIFALLPRGSRVAPPPSSAQETPQPRPVDEATQEIRKLQRRSTQILLEKDKKDK